jgi:hypothetical protein
LLIVGGDRLPRGGRDGGLAVALAARPVARTHRQAYAAFAAGDHDAHVPVRTRDEIGQLCLAFNGMIDDINQKNVVIETKNRENEELLLNVLPAPIANRLRGGEQGIADGFAEVTVAFADLVGFTELSSEMPPARRRHAVERPVYAASISRRASSASRRSRRWAMPTWRSAGMPVPVPNHAERMVRMAIRMVHITRENTRWSTACR